ncbi:MAG: hypothetical protein ACYCW6_21695 [Candidatus Xenobia bacterium]
MHDPGPGEASPRQEFDREYARSMAGSASDLDPELEAASAEHLREAR